MAPAGTVASKQATIVEVARRAGVSVGTASLALNGSKRCAAATVARVEAAAAELRYLPNHAAKSLRRQTSESIALVIPDIGNPVYVAMAKAVQRVAKERRYHLSLISTDGLAPEEVHALQTLARRQVDGLIMCSLRVTPELVAALEAAPGPICVIGQLPEAASVDNVRVDSESGAVLAVEHLLAQGRRRVAFVNGTANTVPALARERGYRRALAGQGMTFDASLVAHADFSVAAGRAAIDALLSRRAEFDAVFCANDVIAIGALKSLRERGLTVPRDVAVVGMDDIEECSICTPTLTSVSLRAEERGRIATEFLLDRLAAPGPLPPQKMTVAPRLVVRESSAMGAPTLEEGRA